MRSFTAIAAVLALLPKSSYAQRPNGTSICDFYTTALLKDNNATNQLTVLTLIVNTAVIGNYTSLSKSAVPGILNPQATFNGQPVNLVPYFNGGFISTNVGGVAGPVNFLDGGGAAPLMQNKPANDNTSLQFTLLTHLYSYFGTALGCSQVGKDGFPAYSGSNSMYTKHQFMALGPNEVGYFISQVGASAKSFGVADDDITIVANLLSTTFDTRCSPKVAVIPSQPADLQAICTDPTCPQSQAQGADCGLYATFPGKPANASSASGGGSSSGGAASPTGTSPASTGSSKPSSAFGNADSNRVRELLAVAFTFAGMAIIL